MSLPLSFPEYKVIWKDNRRLPAPWIYRPICNIQWHFAHSIPDYVLNAYGSVPIIGNIGDTRNMRCCYNILAEERMFRVNRLLPEHVNACSCKMATSEHLEKVIGIDEAPPSHVYEKCSRLYRP